MTLPATGPIKLSAVNSELKISPTLTINLNGAAVRNIAKKLSSSISMSDLRGKAFGTVITKSYDTTSTWVAPGDVRWINVVYGFGSRGQDASNQLVRMYSKLSTITRITPTGTRYTYADMGYGYGSVPAPYCNPRYDDPYEANNSVQECFSFTDESYTDTSPTTGASATAFSKSFPGSTGNVTPSTTQYNGIPVTPGTSYQIYVPAGGRVWFSYDQFIISGDLTGFGRIMIPANTTLTLTGSGAMGGQYYDQGSPYVPAQGDQRHQHGQEAASATYDCSDTPGSSGASNISYMMIPRGNTEILYATWDCVVPGSPAQEAVPPSWQPTWGASTTARLGDSGMTQTFPGSYGPTATSITSKTINTGSTSIELIYSVASGGTLAYSYISGVYS